MEYRWAGRTHGLCLGVAGAVSAQLTPKLAEMKEFLDYWISVAAFRHFSEVTGRNKLYSFHHGCIWMKIWLEEFLCVANLDVVWQSNASDYCCLFYSPCM